MHSNYNVNNNNQLPEFCDFPPDGLFPSMPNSPVKSMINNGFYKSNKFRTAINAITAPEPHCTNFVFNPDFQTTQRAIHCSNIEMETRKGRPQYYSFHHQRHKYQELEATNYIEHRYVGPPAMVHQAARNTNNNNESKHHHLPNQKQHDQHHQLHRRQQSLAQTGKQSPEGICFTPKDVNTNQHYQHYYSYYYNRSPEPQQNSNKKMSRATLITSLKKDIHGGGDKYAANLNNNHELQHQVLKDKTSNNNIINYEENVWLGHMQDPDLITATRDFDAKDIEDFSDKFNYAKRNDKKTRYQEFNKNKVLFKFDMNNQNETDYDDSDVKDESATYSCRSVKLPITPFNVKGGLENKRTPPRDTQKKDTQPTVIVYKKKNNNIEKPVESKMSRYEQCMSPKPKPEMQANKVNNNIKSKLILDADNDASSDDDDDDDDDDLDNVSDFGEGSTSDESSDSEEGYRTFAYKLTHSTERHPMLTPLSTDSSEDDLINPNSLLVPSLFPNVPPYLSFSSHTHKGPDVPPELHRLLKWRVSNVMPKVVRYVLSNSGMRLVKKTNDWMGVWGKHMKSPLFRTIRPYQKINHLPGSFKIGRKDSCWRNLQKQMNKHGKKEFGFMPKTYIIPYDLSQLRKNWPRYSQNNVKWIIKPPASARGTGIRVVNRWAQIPKRRPLIVQKYIERPLLINGSKFDLRLYVLVTSINPLRVFMYHNGLARFASVKYSDKSETLNDRCMHLTNYSINKLSSNYAKNEDVNACHGHKWTLKSLWKYLANRGVRTDCLWEALRNLVLRTIMAGEQSINNMIRLNVGSRYSCFELFGFDVLLDSDLVPWLLEVNISPSLHSELPLDSHVKAPLVQGVLNTALYNIPPKLTLEKQREIALSMALPCGQICYDKRMYINYLSRVEKIKHNTFTRKVMEDREEYINEILENLTPDDVRCLVIAEDELARCSPLERIFPTPQTYKYLKFTETPRYYNRLLDAWETRYGNNRAEGIALLRSYCDKKYHLDVPPPPAKKDSNASGADDDDEERQNENGEEQYIGPIFKEEESGNSDSSQTDPNI